MTFNATGSCSVLVATVTMTSGTGICSVTATKAADSNYRIGDLLPRRYSAEQFSSTDL